MAKLCDLVKPEPVAKYEALVEQKLAQARGRIRLLDFTAGLLGFLIGTMIFALVMGWLDRWLQFSLTTRQTALAVYGLAAIIYLAAVFLRPLLRPLNPYYAARQVEHVLPGAKNSVINWLDLRHEKLPSAIRGAVSHRAAKDIGQANLEEAINGRRALSLGAVTLILFLITVAFMFFGPGLGRVFQPIGSNPSTEIRIVKPEGGNGTVAEGRAVTIEAVVEGRQTEALRFLYRHHQSDPFEERPMERGESARDWVITIPAFEVHNGFWYKLVGTEAATDEYHIEVRSAPAFREFEITYHPRPYLRLPDETVKTHQADLKGIRGTEVAILARTNRRIRIEESGLLINGQKDTVKAEPVTDDPQAMRFHLVLDQDGSYGIQFTSTDTERNNPIFYTITAVPDKAPEVRITKPQDEMISLPANGLLQVEGSATDDHGLTGFTLQMQIKPKEGKPEPLPAKPFRPGTSFKLADDSFPQALDYQDFVELDKVRPGGQSLQPETVVEYWLEATDNCDYPAANVGRSKSKFVTIKPSDPDAQKQEEKKAQAKKENEQKQAEQDQKLKEQNQAKQDQPQPQENPPDEPQSPEEKKFQDIKQKLNDQLKQQAKQDNADGSKSEAQKESDKGDGDKNPKGDQQDGKKKGQPQEGSGQKDSDKNEGDKSPKGDKGNEKAKDQNKTNPDQNDSDKNQKGKNPKDSKENKKNDGQQDQQSGDKKGDEENKSTQNPDPQKQGKDGQPNEKNPKGAQDGGPKPGKDKQEKPDNSKGDQQKKEERKGAGEGSKQTGKNTKDTEPGPSNSNSPPKPGMNDKAPQKDGQSDQPGQEKRVNPPDKKAASEKAEQGERKGTSPEKGDPSKNDEPSHDKPASDQGKPKEGAKGDKSADPKDPSKGQDAQPAKKIGELLKAIKEGDAKAKEEARKELKKMSEQAKTPAEREAAKEALKKSDQGSTPGEKTSDDKKGKPGAESGNNEKKGEPSEPDKSKPPQPGGQKQGENGKPGDGSSSAKESQPTKESGQGKGDQEGAKGSKGAQGSDQNPGKPGNNPGGSNQGNRENASPGGAGTEAEAASEANKEFQKKAGDLQLEDYRKKITKEMLQKAKITDQEYEDFLKAYKEKLNREGAEKSKPDPLADPRRQGGSMTNRASHQVQSAGKKEDKLPQAGRGGAPPGYVESYTEFREKTSRSSPQKSGVKNQESGDRNP